MNAFRFSFFATLITICCFFLGADNMTAQNKAKVVNGYSVNYLEFGQNGKRLGVYEQIEAKKWREVGSGRGASKFNFAETHRDEWSVYLVDKSRNVNIQLDLHRKEVIYSDSRKKRVPIYTIMKTSDKVNGWLAKEVVYNRGGVKGGTFMQKEGKNWQEVSVKDGKHNFTETHRDQWSVYLVDKGRNVSIQLDLHTKKVMYAIGNNKKTALYNIVSAADKVSTSTPTQPVNPTPTKPNFTKIDHNATYQIMPAYHKMVLDVPGSSKSNGAKIHQWTSHGGANQQFRLEPKGNGYYVIVNVNSGKALDVPGASKADGTQIIQWDKHGGANQQFGFEKVGTDKYIIYNRNSGKVLDVYGGSRKNGGKITQFPKHGRENQVFKLVKVTKQPVKPASNVVNGYSVNYLEFGQNGKKLGVYEQIAAKKWREVGSARGSSKFSFTETHRDEWSVYLVDKSRNVNIQLDLHRKEVIYSDSRKKRVPIYTIMKTSSKMNGWLAKEVTYSRGGVKGGTFIQKEGKSWQEISVKDGKHNFTETHRDQWSVYLIDKGRNVSIQLDLHTKKVMYALGGQKKTALYTIIGAK